MTALDLEIDIDEELGLNSKWSVALARSGFVMTSKQYIPPPPCIVTLYFTTEHQITVNEVILFRDDNIQGREPLKERFTLHPFPFQTTLILHLQVLLRP